MKLEFNKNTIAYYDSKLDEYRNFSEYIRSESTEFINYIESMPSYPDPKLDELIKCLYTIMEISNKVTSDSKKIIKAYADIVDKFRAIIEDDPFNTQP